MLILLRSYRMTYLISSFFFIFFALHIREIGLTLSQFQRITQWAKILKKVQIRKAALFAIEAEINFLKKNVKRNCREEVCRIKKNNSKGIWGST